MVDLEDDAEWATKDIIEDEEDDRYRPRSLAPPSECIDDFVSSNAVVGESSLDRLSCALGGKTVLQCILNTVQTMLQNRQSFRSNPTNTDCCLSSGLALSPCWSDGLVGHR